MIGARASRAPHPLFAAAWRSLRYSKNAVVNVGFGSEANSAWSNGNVRFAPESGHRVAADTDARTACVSWVRPASTLLPTAWTKHPLDNDARKLVRSAV